MAEDPSKHKASEENPLHQFVLDFVKALLQTGYYTSEHPQAIKFLKVLHNSFQRAIGDRPEITFIKKSWGDHQEVIVDGFDPDREVSLADALPREVVNIFLPKFLEFFFRKKLISFSLKASVREDEFISFVSLMSETPITVGTETRVFTTAQISQELQQRGVSSISVVVEEDLLYVSGKLPWRVEVALARLKRDLSVIPFFKNKDEDELRRLEELIMCDIMRPVRDAEFARDILLHVDLIQKGSSEPSLEDLESKLLRFLHNDIRISTVTSILSFMQSKSSAEMMTGVKVVDRAKEVIAKMKPALMADHSEASEEILQHLFVRKVVAFDELPKSVQKRLYLEDAVNRFINDQSNLIEEMDHCGDEEAYKTLMKQVLNMLQLLSKKEAFVAARDLIELLADHSVTDSGVLPQRKEIASQTLNYLWQNTNWLQHLFRDSGNRKPMQIEALLDVARIAGAQAIPQLVLMLDEVWEESVRHSVCEMMIEIGKQGLPALVESLVGFEQSDNAKRYIVRVIGEMADPMGVEAVQDEIANEDSSVRREALLALCKIKGDEAQTELVRQLTSEHLDVANKSADLLGQMAGLSNESVKGILIALAKSEEAGLQSNLLRLLARVGNVTLSDKFTVENTVIRWLKNRSSSFQKMIADPLKPEVEVGICRLLGKLGTQASLEPLKTLAGSGDEDVKQQANSALKYLKKRLG